MDARTPVRRSHLIPNAAPREVYDVVTDFEQYPRLFAEIKSARVIERTPDRARVEFRADSIVAVRYVLDLTLRAELCAVDWSYVEGEIVVDSTGGWRFVEAPPGGVQVDYRAAVTIKAPLPAFLVRRATDALVAASLPGMFASIEKEVRRRSRPQQAPPGPAG